MASSNDIPPGGEGKITFIYKTKKRCGIDKQRLTIETNDPASPVISLEVTADLFYALEVPDPSHYLTPVKPIGKTTTTFVFQGEMLDEAEITGIRLKEDVAYPDAYSWELHDTKTDDVRELSLDVSIDSALIPPGNFDTGIIVTTGFDMPELELQVFGYMLNPIYADPEDIYIRHIEVTCDMVNSVTFKSNTGLPFKILDAAIEDGEFKLDPWSKKAGLEHTLTFHYCPSAPRDRFNTKLTIKTDIERYGESAATIHAYQRWPIPTPRSLENTDQ
ncbi:MAG: hypothetical protein WBM02_02880 [bacterium]